jgi:hypothetical protein
LVEVGVAAKETFDCDTTGPEAVTRPVAEVLALTVVVIIVIARLSDEDDEEDEEVDEDDDVVDVVLILEDVEDDDDGVNVELADIEVELVVEDGLEESDVVGGMKLGEL